VEHMQTFSFNILHTFSVKKTKLLCAEQIWMSDENHPNHYRKTHSVNKGTNPLFSMLATLTVQQEQN
jgi:hypothetical protein